MGNVSSIVGLFWGDEGKGKVSAFLAPYVDLCIRANGGNNAGHTVVDSTGKKFPLHLVPSTIVTGNCVNLLGAGVDANLQVLSDEIDMLVQNGISVTPENFKISSRSHIVMPYHIAKDGLDEELKSNGGTKVGTTKRGIGPTVSDKVERIGIRFYELVNWSLEKLTSHIDFTLRSKYNLSFSVFSDSTFTAKDLVNNYLLKYRDKLAPFVCDDTPILMDAFCTNKNVLIEGAQSYYLSLERGDYPFVTSNDTSAPGTLGAACVAPKYANEVYGVMKAYCSRVGDGPFNTESTNADLDAEDSEQACVGDLIRELGHEYGTTTGRPRRCGWLDLVRLSTAVKLNGVTALCLNHLDTIGKVGNIWGFIKVATSYLYNGKEISYVPIDSENCQAIYETLEGGWDIPENCECFEDLPEKAREYVELIEKYADVPVKFIGIGPADKDMIVRE